MDGRSAMMTFGFPRMHKEAAERRDFLPPLVAMLADLGCDVVIESGLGSGMGRTDEDYTRLSPRIAVASERECYAQDIVLVLRSPDDRFGWMRPGGTLISMLHFPTRLNRVQRLLELGLHAISLDSIEDDEGARLVVNPAAVAWNGLEAAFDVLDGTWPPSARRGGRPVHVTIMGAGEIGKHAVEAATKYGNLERADRFARLGLPGVEVTTIGRNMTCDDDYLHERLATTDVLVDATQRHDPSAPLIRNAWLAPLPEHAVICDLVVDPYLLSADPPTVRGIEGIPQGNLDRFELAPDDPEWDAVPSQIPTAERRWVVSCYSWPGVHAERSMQVYGTQLAPLLQALVERGGTANLRTGGSFHERALVRATLAAWAPPLLLAEA